MNGKIARSGLFDSMWIHPAAHDSGTSVGAALYGYHNLLRQPRTVNKSPKVYLGPGHPSTAVESALKEFDAKITHHRPADLYDEVSAALAAGKVVGWYQGRMEWGPRALGNRSILADPRIAGMKDKLNKRVKHRQAFRPFAPVVLEERAHEIFEGERESPFMLLAERVRPQWRDRIPAVVHVDGTARLQTVRADQNEPLYRLLKEFDAITGVPVLLNTSFNIKGEPIVETPQDAVHCFLTTGIDYLVMHDVVLSKKRAHRMLAPLIASYSELANLVRTAMTAELRH